jgi:hypothetical protein
MYGFTKRGIVMRVFRFHQKGKLDVGCYRADKHTRLALKDGHDVDSETRLIVARESVAKPCRDSEKRFQSFIGNRHDAGKQVYFAFSSRQQAKDWFDVDDCIDMFVNECVLSELDIKDEDVVELTKQVLLFTESGIEAHTRVVREIPFETLYPELTGLLY